MFDDLKSPKCPARSLTKKQECNRRPEQDNWNREKISEFALQRAHDQINSPAHDPAGGYEEPNSKQAATPSDGRQLIDL